MAYSAAGMFGGATFVGLLENALPEGQRSSPIPSLIALDFVAVLVYWGPRFPDLGARLAGPDRRRPDRRRDRRPRTATGTAPTLFAWVGVVRALALVTGRGPATWTAGST